MFSFNPEQSQEIINQILKNQGLNKVLEMVLNGLMYSERQAFLEENKGQGNKGNGFRYGRALGCGKELT